MPLFHLLCAPLLHVLGERAQVVIAMRIAMLPLYALALLALHRIARTRGPHRLPLGPGGRARLLPLPSSRMTTTLRGVPLPAERLVPRGMAAQERVMVIAPHPDDETLGAGGLLQQTVAADGAVRVLFATDGEDNPWPQRILERRWRIGAVERARWASRRRAEALAALRVLGVQAESVQFLGLPDQQVTDVLLREQAPETVLAARIRDWRPTLLVAPSMVDLHPDHSALAVLLELAWRSIAPEYRCTRLEYVIHGPLPARLPLPLCAAERSRKEEAIRCHASQLLFHHRGFLRRSRVEHFVVPGAAQRGRHRPVQGIEVDGTELFIDLVTGMGWAPLPATLHVITYGFHPGAVRWTVPLRLRNGWVPMRDPRSGRMVARASFARGWGWARIGIPLEMLARSHRLFIKLERRELLFDAAGWQDVPLHQGDARRVSVPAAQGKYA